MQAFHVKLTTEEGEVEGIAYDCQAANVGGENERQVVYVLLVGWENGALGTVLSNQVEYLGPLDLQNSEDDEETEESSE